MKFIVKESQIDSFLETHNQYKKYSEGLNIIFGENEIGKSTLMNFIKGILTKESDAKGYIKCEQDGKEFELRAEKKSKENNQYLDKINSHNFKEGFIITLDDIVYSSKKDAQTLVDKIKDSSSEGIKEREKELYGEIDCYIKMKTKNASNKLTPFFDEISKLEDDIRNTQQTEGLYNDICLELENLSKKIENLKKKQTCAELILDKEKLLEDISNISVNKILMNNKEKFYKLKENHSILKNKKMLCENDINILGKLKNDYETIKKSLDKIEYFEENDIHSFELNKDNLKEAKNITDTLNELVKDEDRIQKDIQNLRDNLKENETEKILLKEQIEELGIKNLKEYEEDKITLESYKMTYGELREKARQNDILNSKDIYSSVITLIFVVIFAISLYYLVTYNSLKVFLSICTGASLVGGIIGVFNCFHNKKTKNKLNYTDELNNLVKLSIDLCNKYDFNIDKTDFLSQLGTQIHIMTEKISKADNINRYINNLEKSDIKTNSNVSEKNEKLVDIRTKKDNILLKKEEFLSKVKVQNIENYSEIFENIKELKDIKNKISEIEENISKTDEEIKKFIINLNDFIKELNADDIDYANKYDFNNTEIILDKIKDILNQEIKKEGQISSYKNKLKETEEKLIQYSEEVKQLEGITYDDLERIKTEKDNITRTYGQKEQEKSTLEQVSGLIELKNNKNIKTNTTKEFLKTLMVKEIIYNLIISAKEKFNEKQPNLVCAKNYLSKITCGRYNEIDFENKTISGENIGEKDWDKLSRGTKEQLYLALRLGFAENFSNDINGNNNNLPDMPLIIDDAFVNFDKTRTGAILKCLEKISKNNQVFFFTCHTDNVKEILEREKIKYNGIELDNSEF